METENPPFPYFTWDCANDLEDRFKKTLYHGGKRNCMGAVSPVALTDLAVSIYVAAAPSPKRKLTAGYIGSVAKRLAINPCTMMLGLLYCERLRQINPEYLNKISSSDLFVISLVISSKFLNDEGEDDEIFNDEWAEAGGLAVSTVNRLEREFLDAMQWKAFVSPKEFLHFSYQLEARIALKNGMSRGWFSYTDLTRILAQIHYFENVKTAMQSGLKVVFGCTMMYSLSLGILLSSAACFSASYAKNTVAKSQPSDPHPYADRPISRARTTKQLHPIAETMETRFGNQATLSSNPNITHNGKCPCVVGRNTEKANLDHMLRFDRKKIGNPKDERQLGLGNWSVMGTKLKMHCDTSDVPGNMNATTNHKYRSSSGCFPSGFREIHPSSSTDGRITPPLNDNCIHDCRHRPPNSSHQQSKENHEQYHPGIISQSSSFLSKLDHIYATKIHNEFLSFSNVLFVDQVVFPVISGYK